MRASTSPSRFDSDLCFWHPVGAHVGESLDEICRRKVQDVKTFGFTLWSFAPAKEARVRAWRDEFRRERIRSCLAVCCGDAARDPYKGGPITWVSEYSSDLVSWVPLPSPRMSSYHRGRNSWGVVASAFMVTELREVENARVARPKNWFRAQDCSWANSFVPTRGQYLVREPRFTPEGQRLRVLMTVADPFVVWLR